MVKGRLQRASSLAGFIETIKEAQPPSGFLTFRGHRKAGWKVEPGIQRAPRRLLEHEKQAVRDLLSIHPQEFAGDRTMFDRLVRMQHFGLPTRLLDVTANPLVALHFAVEEGSDAADDGEVIVFTVPDSRKKYFDSDAVSCVANLANLTPQEKAEIERVKDKTKDMFNKEPTVDRLLQFIRDEKPHFRPEIIPEELFRQNYVVPKLNNPRIVAQAGAFLIYGISTADRAKSGRELIQIARIPIAASAKPELRRELDMLGINESTLFPEIDRAASYVARRYGAVRS